MKIDFGSKYEFKVDQTPPPGFYENDESKMKLLPRGRSAFIYTNLVSPRQREAGPGPGEYDGHLKPFGDLPQNMTIQGKHNFKPNDNPPPGLYEVDTGIDAIKPTNPYYSQSQEKRMKKVKFDESPDAGMYDPHKGFGSDGPNITMGSPFKFSPSDTPGPGTYEADLSIEKIKPTNRSFSINKPLYTIKRVGDNPPHVYDGHLKPFGADVNDRAIW